MSIHELAKEIGVSEYALKKYGKENGIFRAGESCRYGYEFSKKDLEKIKKLYKRNSHSPRKEDSYVWIFYKCIFQPGNVRYSTPVGRFDISHKDILVRFIESQKYMSSYGKLSCHFEIINNHTAELRISKILNQKIEEETLNLVSNVLPLKIEDIQNAIKTNMKITDENIFGKSLECQTNIMEIYLDDLPENTILK